MVDDAHGAGAMGSSGAVPDSTAEYLQSLLAAHGAPASSSVGHDSVDSPDAPEGLGPRPFQDWSEYMSVAEVLTLTDATGDAIPSWANNASPGQKIRASGHSHNWSPLVVKGDEALRSHVMLVDTKHFVPEPSFVAGPNGQVHATFGTGMQLDAATAYLETIGPQNPGAAPGYSFLNMPTPGGLTLGGILAVGGHGTSVPVAGQSEPALMGCLSNLITKFTAVTVDPNAPGSPYELRTYDRDHPDAWAFLVHLGRAFITEVTLAAVPNYYLQLTNIFPEMSEVMAAPSSKLPANALASMLDSYGRVEIVWFPYQPMAWVQCNTRVATKPTTGRWVTGPYNYGFMNGIKKGMSDKIRVVANATPGWAPLYHLAELLITTRNLEGAKGVLNGTARSLEIYLTDDTLRMSILGYVLQLKRSQVQQAANAFYKEILFLNKKYGDSNPVSGAIEIRCTTIDEVDALGISGAQPPGLSATHAVNSEVDTVLWVDVLAFPPDPEHNDGAPIWNYLTELEQWMITTWASGYSPGALRPEWSKGWAFTPNGPWTDANVIKNVPTAYDLAADGLTFQKAKATLAKYDPKNVFSNGFLDQLFA